MSEETFQTLNTEAERAAYMAGEKWGIRGCQEAFQNGRQLGYSDRSLQAEVDMIDSNPGIKLKFLNKEE